jgi:hypothetical protein
VNASPVGLTVDVYGDGTEMGIVTAFSDRGVTVEAGSTIIASSAFSGLYARVAAMVPA